MATIGKATAVLDTRRFQLELLCAFCVNYCENSAGCANMQILLPACIDF